MRVPSGLDALRGAPGADEWFAALPGLVAELSEMWQLAVGDPFDGCNVSWVAPVVRDGEPLVLKVQWPHPECEHEAAALAVWDGDGAVRLVAHDAPRHALLLERCEPGAHLAADSAVDAIAVFTDVLPRLWKPTSGPFRTLADEADGWSSHLLDEWEAADRPCEPRLVDAALAFLDELPPSQGEQVLLHQDLHGQNVLSARRGAGGSMASVGWLVIDPKPLVGERELSVAPIVRDFELGHTEAEVVGRLDRLCDELGLDHERARGWSIAQTMAWSFDSSWSDQHFQTVRWLLERA